MNHTNFTSPRYHFTPSVAFEHVAGDTWRWVTPIDGRHVAYVTARHVTYAPSLAAQLFQSKTEKAPC